MSISLAEAETMPLDDSLSQAFILLTGALSRSLKDSAGEAVSYMIFESMRQSIGALNDFQKSKAAV